jgi:hypothetical protein
MGCTSRWIQALPSFFSVSWLTPLSLNLLFADEPGRTGVRPDIQRAQRGIFAAGSTGGSLRSGSFLCLRVTQVVGDQCNRMMLAHPVHGAD